MNRETRKGWAVGLTIVAAVVGINLGIVALEDSSQGNEQCYLDFPAAYSWNSIRADLSVMWKDKKLTRGECDEMYELYDKAKQSETVEKIDGEIRKLNPITA